MTSKPSQPASWSRSTSRIPKQSGWYWKAIGRWREGAGKRRLRQIESEGESHSLHVPADTHHYAGRSTRQFHNGVFRDFSIDPYGALLALSRSFSNRGSKRG